MPPTAVAPSTGGQGLERYLQDFVALSPRHKTRETAREVNMEEDVEVIFEVRGGVVLQL